jgi:hypothetical protein
MGEDEHGSGPSAAVFFAARLAGVPLTFGHLIGPPPDAHGAGGRRDLRERVRRHESKIQFIAWPGPAMKPSSDIELFTTTLPFPVLVSLTLFLRRTLGSSRDRSGAFGPVRRVASGDAEIDGTLNSPVSDRLPGTRWTRSPCSGRHGGRRPAKR